jgi:signal transduction histidine kinase
MTITQKFILKFLAYVTTMQMGMSFFIGLATYKKHTSVQRFNLYYSLIMNTWTYLSLYNARITGNNHFLDRFYILIHVTMGINLVFLIAKSDKLKTYTTYSFLIYLAIWLIYISTNELVKTSPILAGTSYAYANILMLFLLYDNISNSINSLFNDPGIYITVGTYFFFAGTAIIFILLQHYMVYWQYFPDARFYKPLLHIACNFIFYCLFIYSFIRMQSIDKQLVIGVIVTLLVIFSLLIFIVATILLYQRKLREKQYVLFQSVIDAEEKERKRIATELHDSLGASLSAVKLYFESLMPTIADQDKSALVYHMLDNACNEVRGRVRP